MTMEKWRAALASAIMTKVSKDRQMGFSEEAEFSIRFMLPLIAAELAGVARGEETKWRKLEREPLEHYNPKQIHACGVRADQSLAIALAILNHARKMGEA